MGFADSSNIKSTHTYRQTDRHTHKLTPTRTLTWTPPFIHFIFHEHIIQRKKISFQYQFSAWNTLNFCICSISTIFTCQSKISFFFYHSQSFCSFVCAQIQFFSFLIGSINNSNSSFSNHSNFWWVYQLSFRNLRKQ